MYPIVNGIFLDGHTTFVSGKSQFATFLSVVIILIYFVMSCRDLNQIIDINIFAMERADYTSK